jgi:hypothetical protein
MADDDGSAGRFRSLVSNGQLLLTLLTAAFSFYLSVQQSNIKKKQDELSIEQQKLTVTQSEIKTKQDELNLGIATKTETEKWAESSNSRSSSWRDFERAGRNQWRARADGFSCRSRTGAGAPARLT